MERRSEWLTGIRIRRLQIVLLATPTIPAGLTRRDAERHLWRKCGGPLEEVPLLLEVLSNLKLMRAEGDLLKRTGAGDRMARSLRQRDSSVLGITLIRSGHFFDQARVLLQTARIDDKGTLRCSIRASRGVAPQLVAILEQWEGVITYPELVIPSALVQELNSVWALLPPAIETPKWAAERKAVGNRAEMYTVQRERSRVNPALILWVARDTDALGFDVEDTSVSPSRCIEVKGRRDNDVVFYLSEHEWEKAKELGERYEVQFWGGIDLQVQPAVEYTLLRQNGYPIEFRNPAALIGTVLLSAAVSWRFSLLPTK